MTIGFLGHVLLVPGLGYFPPVPEAPANLQVTGASGGIVADLTPTVIADAVSGATGYDFEVALSSTGLTGTATVTNQPTPAYTFAEQANHYTYVIAIRARNAAGPGPWSAGVTVHISVFTQALGAELLANGDFSAWTGDNPDNFTVTGESGSDPMVTEVAPGGGAGNGAARFFSTGTSVRITQTGVMTTNAWYEAAANISAYTSGIVDLLTPGTPGSAIISGILRAPFQAGGTDLGLRVRTSGDFTADSLSLKAITLNDAATYPADGTFDFHFTPPASPRPGEQVILQYRINSAAAFWQLFIKRNSNNTAWDCILWEMVNPLSVTQHISVTGIAAVNALRVVASGNNHDVYTSDDGGANWTQRGTTITDATYAAATGVRAIYASTVTPIGLDNDGFLAA